MIFKNENLFLDFIRKNKNDLTFVCIGTTEYLWDSFGPLLGDELIKIPNLKVVGNSKNEINGENIEQLNNFKFNTDKTIYIDSFISDSTNNIGDIDFKDDILLPGLGCGESFMLVQGFYLSLITTNDDFSKVINKNYMLNIINKIVLKIKSITVL